jgi:photosystem II stability/assembly factor-like uncharacterized protein
LKRYLNFLFIASLALASNIDSPPGLDYRQPQITASHGLVALTFGAGHAIYFSGSRDGGKTFSDPVKIADEGFTSIGRRRGPRVAIAGDAIVISAVYGTKPNGGDGDLLAWRSTDGGRTWSKPVRVNDRAASAREGLQNIASDGKGFLYAVWLDDRSGGKALYGASSTDVGATWSANKQIYAPAERTICECCHPSVTIGADGTIYAMFRNWMDGSRDMYLAISRDHGKTFGPAQKLGERTWPLKGCPMDGGGLFAGATGVQTVWRRNDTIYTDRPGSPEVEIGKGKDPAIADDVILWSAPDGLRMQRGAAGSEILDAQGAYPSLAVANGRIIAAWESKGRIVVKDKLP